MRQVLACTHRSAGASPAVARQVHEAGFGCHSSLRGGKPRGGAGVARGRFWPALIAPRGQAPRWRSRCTRLVLAFTHRSAVAQALHEAGSGLHSPLRGGKPREGGLYAQSRNADRHPGACPRGTMIVSQTAKADHPHHRRACPCGMVI